LGSSKNKVSHYHGRCFWSGKSDAILLPPWKEAKIVITDLDENKAKVGEIDLKDERGRGHIYPARCSRKMNGGRVIKTHVQNIRQTAIAGPMLAGIGVRGNVEDVGYVCKIGKN